MDEKETVYNSDYTLDEFLDLAAQLSEGNTDEDPTVEWIDTFTFGYRVGDPSYGTENGWQRFKYTIEIDGMNGTFVGSYQHGTGIEGPPELAEYLSCIFMDIAALDDYQSTDMDAKTYIACEKERDDFIAAFGPLAFEKFMELELW